MARTKYGTYYNDPRPVGRGDYGVRVARKGFDANTAGDSNLLFNSGWRIMQIVKVISEENKKIFIDETQDIPSSYVFEKVEKIGVWNFDCFVDEKWLYLPLEKYVYSDPNQGGRLYVFFKQYRIYHGLGYVPLFFKSKYVSDMDGYYLLTNIDIRQDVDYPYTSKPSYYDGNTKDYGVKSKSYTRSRIPQSGETRGCGINASIQSKLVMAVKTEKTTVEYKLPNGEITKANSPSWAVPNDDNSQTTKLTDYEAFAFFPYGDAMQGWEPLKGKFMEYPVGPVGANKDTYTLVDQWGAAFTDVKKSLVILRSPMVAPDIEEIVVQ